jgi:glycerophosphoryl diester phosphodiesterase
LNQQRLTHLIAHRGNAAEYPENTLPAFVSALGLGVRFIELDVQLSADGVPVVLHDVLLARTTDLPGSVFDHEAAALQRMHAGEPARFGDRYSDVRIPLLSDVLALLERRPDVTLFVEIKRESLAQHGLDPVVAAVIETIRPRRAQCVVISFDLAAIHRARQLGGVPIGWVLSEYTPHAQLKCEALQPEFLFCNHRKLPADGPLWRGPWRWATYEVRSMELALRLAGQGVDYIETMAVRDLSAAMRALTPGA